MMMDQIDPPGPGEPRLSGAVVVTAPTQAGLLEDIERRFEGGAGFCVATLNLDHVVKLRRLDGFRQAYLQHSHVTADGHPIVWLSRLAGRPVDLVPGSDLIAPLIALAARKSVPVAFLGSTPDALDKAAEALLAQVPDLKIVARISPQMGFDPEGPEAEAHIEELRQSGAGLCLLALGAPKQEILAARAWKALPGAGFVSIGAGLDFIAGTQTRAPRLVRLLAAEWLWRMLSAPRRMVPRYTACFAVLPSLALEALRERRRGPGG